MSLMQEARVIKKRKMVRINLPGAKQWFESSQWKSHWTWCEAKLIGQRCPGEII
jgi:hypothetical protein